MAKAKIRREFLAVVMESPVYFSIPILKRLVIRNFFSQRSLHYRISAYNHHLGNAKVKNSDKIVMNYLMESPFVKKIEIGWN